MCSWYRGHTLVLILIVIVIMIVIRLLPSHRKQPISLFGEVKKFDHKDMSQMSLSFALHDCLWWSDDRKYVSQSKKGYWDRGATPVLVWQKYDTYNNRNGTHTSTSTNNTTVRHQQQQQQSNVNVNILPARTKRISFVWTTSQSNMIIVSRRSIRQSVSSSSLLSRLILRIRMLRIHNNNSGVWSHQ